MLTYQTIFNPEHRLEFHTAGSPRAQFWINALEPMNGLSCTERAHPKGGGALYRSERGDWKDSSEMLVFC